MSWLSRNISYKLIALLVVSVFVAVTFSCFTIATYHGHVSDVGAACDTVVTLIDNVVVQTGLTLLLLAGAVAFCLRPISTSALQDALNKMYVFHSPPPDYLASPREFSYLRELFSSGVIHAKLHSVIS